jgi:hypothetical protein
MFGSQTSTLLAQVRNSAPSKAAQCVLKAQAWYEGTPYDGNDPDFTLDADTRPKVIVPIPKMIVDKAASLLFGRAPQLTADDDQVQEFVQEVWGANRLVSKLLGFARVNAYAGAGWLKFVHNPTPGSANPWPIQYYHQGYVEPVYSTAYPDELERIKITYRVEGADGKLTWYREEWTATDYREWTDVPVVSGQLPNFDKIPPTKQDANTYGEIPLVNWPNLYDPELDPGAGRGDLDGLWSLFHRINIVADDVGLALQLDAKGAWLAYGLGTGAAVDLTPGSVNIASDSDAFIKAVEAGKPHLAEAREFLKVLERWVFNAARIVYFDPTEISLGQLSGLAIRLLYGPSIELTDEKRRHAGEAIEELFEKIARAAKKLGVASNLPAKPDVETVWPELFAPSQEEIAQAQTNLLQAEQAGWITAKEARQKAALLHGFRHTGERDTELDAEDEGLSEAVDGAKQADEELDEEPDQGRGRAPGGRGSGGVQAR